MLGPKVMRHSQKTEFQTHIVYITKTAKEASLLLAGLRAERTDIIKSGYGPCHMNSNGIIPPCFFDALYYCYITIENQDDERPVIHITCIA